MKQSTTTKTPRNGIATTGPASTLKALRALQPKRVLTLTEAKAIAARQANRLRARHEGNHHYAFDETIIIEQPRIRIDPDDQMTMAGSTHWTGSHWQILINANDAPLRRRFTLAHEYKHIIDHGTPVDPDIEEQICDYFAACLLMPKQKVIAAWTDPEVPQTVKAMAKLFVVSTQAMQYRLHDLGLLERTSRRCGGIRTLTSARFRKDSPTGIYYRSSSVQLARSLS